jgi:hypothetical protein
MNNRDGLSWFLVQALDDFNRLKELRQFLELAEEKPEYLALLLETYTSLTEPHFDNLEINLQNAYQAIHGDKFSVEND